MLLFSNDNMQALIIFLEVMVIHKNNRTKKLEIQPESITYIHYNQLCKLSFKMWLMYHKNLRIISPIKHKFQRFGYQDFKFPTGLQLLEHARPNVLYTFFYLHNLSTGEQNILPKIYPFRHTAYFKLVIFKKGDIGEAEKTK